MPSVGSDFGKVEVDLFPAIPPWGLDAEKLFVCSLEKNKPCRICWHYWPRTMTEHMNMPHGELSGKCMVEFNQVGWRERA